MTTITIFTEDDLEYVSKNGDETIDKTDVTYNLDRRARFKLHSSEICVYKKKDGKYILLKNRFPSSAEESIMIRKFFNV